MSTDENITTTAAPEGVASSSTNEPSTEASPSPAATATASPVAPAGAEAKPAAPEPPAASDDDWQEEPGDDIGNRLPGAADDKGARRSSPAAATTGPSAAATGEEGPKRKRRRRRKRGAAGEGSADAEQAEGTEQAEASAEGEPGSEGSAAGAGAEKAKPRRKKAKPPRPEAQRPAFRVGEEVFGRICKITEEAIWIDIAGKAVGLFDSRELAPGFAPPFEPIESTSEKTEGTSENAEASSENAEASSENAEASSENAEASSENAEATSEATEPPAPRPEMKVYGEDEQPQEGDQFIATVASNGVRGGMLMLSRFPARFDAARKWLEAASKSGELIEGFVTGTIKGGLEVDLRGMRAFAPASHMDLRHGADLSYLVGRRLDFTVEQYAKRGRDVVVSRKRMLEAEGRKSRAEALAHIEPGSMHKGVVRSVVAWGVFVALVDAGGVEGLVHLTEASHDRGAKLSDLFKPGEEVEVKVLRVDDHGKLWLSRKAATVDPWEAVKQKYAIGTRHKGKVARLQPFGAFIELEAGIDGLIHTADLSLKPIDHPNEILKVDGEIDVVVAALDAGGRKIGLHPALPASEEEEPRQRVQPHKSVKVAVVQAIEGGLVVRVLGITGRNARGFIPAGQTGTARGTDLRKEFPVGTRLETKVLEVDPRRGEAKLSIRALKEDVEKHAYQQYRAGVARDAKFGTFADLLKKR
jgi:small subunit ribosomal protein S1